MCCGPDHAVSGSGWSSILWRIILQWAHQLYSSSSKNDMQTEVDSYLAFSSLSIPNSSHQSSTNTYVPHNKEWLKEKIYGMLKRQANSK